MENAHLLDRPVMKALMAEAVKRAVVPFDPAPPGRWIIRFVSAKQHPWRSAGPRVLVSLRGNDSSE